MKKRYRIVWGLISLLITFIFPIQAENNYTKEDMERTIAIFAEQNEWYQKTDIKAFSEEIWQNHGLLVLKKQPKNKNDLL